jgi:hypothetical protein
VLSATKPTLLYHSSCSPITENFKSIYYLYIHHHHSIQWHSLSQKLNVNCLPAGRHTCMQPTWIQCLSTDGTVLMGEAVTTVEILIHVDIPFFNHNKPKHCIIRLLHMYITFWRNVRSSFIKKAARQYRIKKKNIIPYQAGRITIWYNVVHEDCQMCVMFPQLGETFEWSMVL